MATLRYAGIGARATRAAVLADMKVMAGWLARTGWHLSSGGADGADSAFANPRFLILPWIPILATRNSRPGRRTRRLPFESNCLPACQIDSFTK